MCAAVVGDVSAHSASVVPPEGEEGVAAGFPAADRLQGAMGLAEKIAARRLILTELSSLPVEMAEGRMITLMREELLDVEIALLYDGGGCFGSAIGGKGSVTIPTEDIDVRAESGAVILVTHNHPKGRPFSEDDFMVFLRSKATELHAVTRDYIFIARKTTPGLHVRPARLVFIRFPKIIDPKIEPDIEAPQIEAYFWGHSLAMCDMVSQNVDSPFEVEVLSAEAHLRGEREVVPLTHADLKRYKVYYRELTDRCLMNTHGHVSRSDVGYTWDEPGNES